MAKSKTKLKTKSKTLNKLAKSVLDLWTALQLISVDGLYGPVELFDEKPTCVKMAEEILKPPEKKSEKPEPTTNPDEVIGDLFE